MRRRAGGERGAGSVLVIAATMVVVAVLLAVTTLASGYQARHHAAAAADLSALAGAERLRATGAEPCGAARQVSAANGAELRDCAVDGWEVEVVVEVESAGPLRWLPDPRRRARAGVDPPAQPGPSAATRAGWLLPVEGDHRITARFGEAGPRWAAGVHTGLDFAAPAGTPVVASAGGRVTRAGHAGPYGRLVVVDHGGMSTYYAHLSSVSVAVGDTVEAGQRLGAVGATGNATGPHLHFEVRSSGEPRDPEVFLRADPP